MSRVSGKPYFVYVLWSPSGQVFYVEISEDRGTDRNGPIPRRGLGCSIGHDASAPRFGEC